jgi:hypothetical protein
MPDRAVPSTAVDRTRRASVLALGAWLAGRGGGGSTDAGSSPTFAGSLQTKNVTAQSNGVAYPLYIYLSHDFSAYLASDASIGCMQGTVYDWDDSYAARFTTLPVRLHVSYAANVANGPFVEHLQDQHYAGLVLASGAYRGGHLGMIPAAFADAITFAFAA